MRLHIEHLTTYRYRCPVAFQRHRLVIRPREGHDVRIERLTLRMQPQHRLEWVRDVYGNSIALVDWLEPSDTLEIASDVLVEKVAPFPGRALHEPWYVPYPPTYEPLETAVASAYLVPSYLEDASVLRSWLTSSLTTEPGDAEGTMLALSRLVFATVRYQRRPEKGVQTPAATIECGTGSCRDMAALMMDSARVLGVAARFASGYLHGTASMAGRASTHAWTEVYLPTLGWRGFDPTLGEVTASGHIVTGVSGHPRGVMPVTGSFTGTASDLVSLDVQVRTTVLPAST